MMTIQAKRLRQVLKAAGIVEHGKTPSVKTERFVRNIKGEKRFYEFGLARTTIFKMHHTPEQLEMIRKDESVKVYLETENCMYLES